MAEQYKVGYGKPPKYSQFKAGQSGNPKGRRKGIKNINTIMTETLKERILFTENGKTYKVSKKQALCRRLVNKGLAGDPKSIAILFDYMQNRDMLEEDRKAFAATPSSLEDKQVISLFLQRNGDFDHGKE